MFPFEADSLHIQFVGEGGAAAAGLAGGDSGEVDIDIDVQRISYRQYQRDEFETAADCVVLRDGVAATEPTVVETVAAESVPTILLVDGEGAESIDGQIVDAVTLALPTALFRADADTARQQVASVVERERARSGLRDIYDEVAGTVAIHDTDTGEMVHANQRLCELLGYDRQELLARRVGEFTADVEGYTHARAMETVRGVAERGQSTEVEWPLEASDGTVRWVEVELKPVTIGHREVVLSVSSDITERKRREREYEQIFNGVTEGIAIQDPETAELLDANETFLDRLGYDDVAELREQGIDGLSVTEAGYTRERAKELCARVMESGEPETVEWQQRTKSGERRWIEARVNPATIGGEERIVSMQRDVTERRELEATYRDVFENVSDGLVVHEPDTGTIVDVNERFCAMNGYERDELVGESVEVVAGPNYSLEQAKERIAAAREGSPQLFEWRNRRADGSTFPVEVHLSVVDIRGNERILASVRDITERKRREREFEQIFNSVNDVINVYDTETKQLIQVNDRMCELTGYDRETILAEGLDLVSATDEGFTSERAGSVIDAAIESGETEELEWCIETADGERRWLEVSATPATINGAERLVTISRDVTERKRREREYEQIFNGVTDAITVHDPETGDVLDVNETMCELTGYDREELLAEGQEAINVAEEGYASGRAREIVREVMETNEPRTLEWLIERKDGERRWLEVNATPTMLNGEERYLAIMRDVTSQRRTERRLREIVERIDEAIYLTRAEQLTDPTLHPDDLSAGYEDIWGRPHEAIFEAHDGGFFGTVHPDDEPSYREFVEAIDADIRENDTEDRYTREYRIERPDGEIRWVRSDFYPTAWKTGSRRLIIVSRDITERKERERRIASFDEATDDLVTAETPAEATRTAVDAATETLGLSAVGVYLYDGDRGNLCPRARTGALAEASAPDAIEPGDSPLWDCFATGTIVGPDDGATKGSEGATDGQAPAGVAALADWRGLSLGNHGLLLVGARDSALDSETVQVAHVLAATLEAALNHLEGQQQLADQEEQLRTQTERAERLDRIASLTRRVEAAITEASSPSEFKRAVCERLASAGPYELAWLGGVEVGADRITAHAVVGESGQYVEQLGLSTTAHATDTHPAVRAWQTESVQVADSLVTDGPNATWRQRALTAGYQSLCAIPLTYDGITHGVVTVGTDSPAAFGERETTVLEQLGTSIGYALAAIERRRALESDETIELEFTGDGVELPFARAAAEADCRVRHERTVAKQGGSVSVSFKFDGDVPDDVDAVASQTLPGDVTVEGGDGASLVTTTTDDWFGAPLAEYGAVLREASATPEGTTVIVEVSSQADVRSFVDRLQEIAPSLELSAKRQHQQQAKTPAQLGEQLEETLTERQFEVVQTALEAGYFEWPRENDGGEVATRLDITQPTLNKHLRLAEKRTFQLLLGES